MNYAEALTKIESIDDGAGIIAAIKNHVSGILDEKKKAVSQANASIQSLSGITELLGIEAGNASEKLEAAKSKISTLKVQVETLTKEKGETEAAKLKLENEKKALEDQAITQQRKESLRAFSDAHGFEPKVVEKIGGEFTYKEVDSDWVAVKIVDGKEQVLNAEDLLGGDWKLYAPSLLQSRDTTNPPDKKTSMSPPRSKTKTPQGGYSSYMSRRYASVSTRKSGQ